MATFPTAPYQTTLSAALDANQVTILTAASTGFAIGKYVIIGKEAMLLVAVDTTNNVHSVKRGMKGTPAMPHASGAIVTLGASSAFGPVTNEGIVVAGYTGGGINCVPTLPIGSRKIDPDTGYEYILCKSASAHVAGEWVSISVAGVSTILDSTTKGRVGVVVEAPGAASKLHWVMVVGSYSSALFAHTAGAVTTATALLAASGTIPGALSAITTCNLQQTAVFNAINTSAITCGSCPITGANPGTVYLNNPWTNGISFKGQFTS